MVVLENLAAGAVTVTAATLTILAFLSWLYSRSRKVLLLTLGFLLFLVKGIMLSIALFLTPSWGTFFLPASLLLDLVILLLFYFAVLQRTGT
jgi:hypothetical protein